MPEPVLTGFFDAGGGGSRGLSLVGSVLTLTGFLARPCELSLDDLQGIL